MEHPVLHFLLISMGVDEGSLTLNLCMEGGGGGTCSVLESDQRHRVPGWRGGVPMHEP